MDNKYGLGSAKVATAHHDSKAKSDSPDYLSCCYCGSLNLFFCSTMSDHYCKDCGEYQSDVPAGYATGHSSDF